MTDPTPMHEPKDAAAAYRAAALENAPPLKIVVMLYEGALRSLERARRMDPDAEAAAFVDALTKADRIVCELRFCLDPAPAPELAQKLEELYLFAEERIAMALSERTIEPLAAAADVLSRLHDGWRSLDAESAGRAA